MYARLIAFHIDWAGSAEIEKTKMENEIWKCNLINIKMRRVADCSWKNIIYNGRRCLYMRYMRRRGIHWKEKRRARDIWYHSRVSCVFRMWKIIWNGNMIIISINSNGHFERHSEHSQLAAHIWTQMNKVCPDVRTNFYETLATKMISFFFQFE